MSEGNIKTTYKMQLKAQGKTWKEKKLLTILMLTVTESLGVINNYSRYIFKQVLFHVQWYL